ncbi:acetylxylan esterase [Roseiconus nitratireducens]|uniref:Acetylxylan esterase n=1 Tax=Roseiconus nitratireducens TaxID=2605748 RepID=A0A5M6DFY0_9BACT|nr:acetylxylan esterase [Roseiconus nitratireducens]KAA5545192.1 acetylxylan esterase [Roseiconus nitratireducens]
MPLRDFVSTGLVHRSASCGLLALVFGLAQPSFVLSESPGQQDVSKLKTLNGHFPFHVPDSVDAWQRRAEQLRSRVMVATGLWPMPTREPIKPVIHGKVQRPGFTAEKVYFQSLPGHFVTGMLFRPSPESPNRGEDGKRPGVLCPHGHGGRLMRLSDQELKAQLESGGEVHEKSGRYPKLARCAHLTRMGCVVFIYDMLGYGDSHQIAFEVAHRHADPRPEESDGSRPCFYSMEADLNLQSIMGLQTWNAIRSLDFLAELPDVDAGRLGVTGGSGGGTQTILLDAIDPRIRVSFPNGMVSTSMQGGCYCENCNYLRIGTGNVELAALFAPKPQGMTAADDWTRDMMNDGFPELRRLYEMLGARTDVMCRPLLQFPHNYNYVTRQTMYRWMAEHLDLSDQTPLVEQDFEPFSEEELSVWDDQHPAPRESGVEHERDVLAWWNDQNDQALDRKRDEGPQEWNQVLATAWRVIFDSDWPQRDAWKVQPIQPERSVSSDPTESVLKSYRRVDQRIEHSGWGTVVDVTVFRRDADRDRQSDQVLVVPVIGGSSDSMDAVLTDVMARSGDSASPAVVAVAHLNPAAGEDAAGHPRQALVDDERDYSAFTFGYNRPLAVKRFRQLLCALAALDPGEAGALKLVATESAIAPSAAAAVVAASHLDAFEIHDPGFRFANVKSYADPDFVPGASKYLDLPGLLSLRAPYPMSLVTDDADFERLVRQAYVAEGAGDALHVSKPQQ